MPIGKRYQFHKQKAQEQSSCSTVVKRRIVNRDWSPAQIPVDRELQPQSQTFQSHVTCSVDVGNIVSPLNVDTSDQKDLKLI